MEKTTGLLSTAQAAERVGCTPATIRRAAHLDKMHRDHLRGKQIGKGWIFRVETIDKWIADGHYHPDRVRKDRRAARANGGGE